MKKSAITTIIAATSVGALGLGIGATGMAAADTASPEPTSSTTTNTREHRADGRHGHHRGLGSSEAAADLAKKLGVTESKLQDAFKEIRDQLRDSDRPDKGSDATEAEREAARETRQAARAKALAEALGIDESKVTKAFAELAEERKAEHLTKFKERLASAVTDGQLTQAEADAVLKAAEAGVIGMGGPRR